MTYKIGILVGSLRKESFHRQFAQEIIRLLPIGFSGEILEIGQLPLYNQDLDGEEVDPAYVDFRQKMEAYDAYLFLTPEYNRSYAPAIKNALDVGSRPWGQNRWDGKPAAVFSASPGSFGGVCANQALRQVVFFLNMPLLQNPEVNLPRVHTLLENGQFKEDTAKFLRSALESFGKHVEHCLKQK